MNDTGRRHARADPGELVVSTDSGDLERFLQWMQSLLRAAAEHFSVYPEGEPVYGWHRRSIGSVVHGRAGPYWLRVMYEHGSWAYTREAWRGNRDAAELSGVAKPRLVDSHEWEDDDACYVAELMTLAAGGVCSPSDALRTIIDLPERWWADIRSSLDTLAGHSTDRVCVREEKVARRFLTFYGDRVSPAVASWTTAHGDLHWANLMAPDLSILDWESWGLAPAGYDAATLYCYSLLVPAVAKKVYDVFSDILGTADGIRAQLLVISRLLLRVHKGDHPDLAVPLHRLADSLTDRRRP